MTHSGRADRLLRWLAVVGLPASMALGLRHPAPPPTFVPHVPRPAPTATFSPNRADWPVCTWEIALKEPCRSAGG